MSPAQASYIKSLKLEVQRKLPTLDICSFQSHTKKKANSTFEQKATNKMSSNCCQAFFLFIDLFTNLSTNSEIMWNSSQDFGPMTFGCYADAV